MPKANIFVDRDTDVAINVEIDTDIDISGFTAEGWLYKHWSSVIQYPITSTVLNNNTVILAFAHEQLNTIEPGRYMYHVNVLTPAGVKTRILNGIVTVNQ